MNSKTQLLNTNCSSNLSASTLHQWSYPWCDQNRLKRTVILKIDQIDFENCKKTKILTFGITFLNHEKKILADTKMTTSPPYFPICMKLGLTVRVSLDRFSMIGARECDCIHIMIFLHMILKVIPTVLIETDLHIDCSWLERSSGIADSHILIE